MLGLTSPGNYLLSGGQETVLVIWQLATGYRQDLPHLTSAIESIVVSPRGDLYAVALANNSFIVLSTAELKVKSSIAGLSSRRGDAGRGSHSNAADKLRRLPLVVHPQQPSRILFPVPSSQSRFHRGSRRIPEPYLQTYDLSTRLAVSRQALTRTNATDLNMGPGEVSIEEPSIDFLQLSHDGKWLATVESWEPPIADLGHLDEGMPEFRGEEHSFRREIYLKFWHWDDKEGAWSLDARVDAPHSVQSVGIATRVFDLAAESSQAGFVTIGEDRHVRIWRPKTRLRNGVVVRGGGEGLVTWSLHHSIELAGRVDMAHTDANPFAAGLAEDGCLAFSADGSVLAASLAWAAPDSAQMLHLIDADAGAIRRSITELDATMLARLAFVGTYLVAVGDVVVVWDLVADQPVASEPLESFDMAALQRASAVHLAANEHDETFAVACSRTDDGTSAGRARQRQSQVSVFSPKQPEPLWTGTVPFALALASLRDGRGYIVLDAASAVRFITPSASVLQIEPTAKAPEAPLALTATEQEQDSDGDAASNTSPALEAEGLDQAVALLPEFDALMLDGENDKPVVRPEALQKVLDTGPSHAMAPVRDMFHAVVGLYARRPRMAFGGRATASSA